MISVLIVENDVVLRSLLTEGLESLDIQVLTADSVSEAIQKIRVQRVNVLLIDTDSNHRRGMRQLRELAEYSVDTHLILASHFKSTKDYQDALDFHALNLLRKPFSRQEVLERVLDTAHRFQAPVSLRGLLRMFHRAGCSTRLMIRDRPLGEVHMLEGQIIHARRGAMSGEEALTNSLDVSLEYLRAGVYRSRRGEPSIDRSIQELLGSDGAGLGIDLSLKEKVSFVDLDFNTPTQAKLPNTQAKEPIIEALASNTKDISYRGEFTSEDVDIPIEIELDPLGDIDFREDSLGRDEEEGDEEEGDEEEGDEEEGDEEEGDEEEGDEEEGDEERGDEERGDEERGDEERGDEERGDEEGGVEEGGDKEGGDEEDISENIMFEILSNEDTSEALSDAIFDVLPEDGEDLVVFDESPIPSDWEPLENTLNGEVSLYEDNLSISEFDHLGVEETFITKMTTPLLGNNPSLPDSMILSSNKNGLIEEVDASDPSDEKLFLLDERNHLSNFQNPSNLQKKDKTSKYNIPTIGFQSSEKKALHEEVFLSDDDSSPLDVDKIEGIGSFKVTEEIAKYREGQVEDRQPHREITLHEEIFLPEDEISSIDTVNTDDTSKYDAIPSVEKISEYEDTETPDRKESLFQKEIAFDKTSTSITIKDERDTPEEISFLEIPESLSSNQMEFEEVAIHQLIDNKKDNKGTDEERDEIVNLFPTEEKNIEFQDIASTSSEEEKPQDLFFADAKEKNPQDPIFEDAEEDATFLTIDFGEMASDFAPIQITPPSDQKPKKVTRADSTAHMILEEGSEISDEGNEISEEGNEISEEGNEIFDIYQRQNTETKKLSLEEFSPPSMESNSFLTSELSAESENYLSNSQDIQESFVGDLNIPDVLDIHSSEEKNRSFLLEKDDNLGAKGRDIEDSEDSLSSSIKDYSSSPDEKDRKTLKVNVYEELSKNKGMDETSDLAQKTFDTIKIPAFEDDSSPLKQAKKNQSKTLKIEGTEGSVEHRKKNSNSINMPTLSLDQKIGLDDLLKQIWTSLGSLIAVIIVDLETGEHFHQVKGHGTFMTDLVGGLLTFIAGVCGSERVASMGNWTEKNRAMKENQRFPAEMIVLSDNLLHVMIRSQKENDRVILLLSEGSSTLGSVRARMVSIIAHCEHF